jgi:hypothetical protein
VNQPDVASAPSRATLFDGSAVAGPDREFHDANIPILAEVPPAETASRHLRRSSLAIRTRG